MSDTSNVGIVVSISTVIASVIAFLAFWTRFSDRITTASNKADNALQEAAEAKNDTDNLREAMNVLIRDHGDTNERLRRDQGESLVAIRQHVTELAMFVRDNFVRNAEFTSAMKDIRDGQKRLEDKLDRAIGHQRGHGLS